jgi:hypothetical protein
MTDAVMGAGAAARSRRFYMWMALACLAISVVGFMPTYFVPMAQGRFKVEPIVHIHGLILFSWMVYFCAQSWLIAQGKVLAHRSWGMLGISIVTALCFIVVATVSMRNAQALMAGQPAGTAHDALAFAWVSISTILFIIPVFTLAIVKLRDTESHKRLILLMTVSMLGAPIARWFLTFLAPPAPPPPVLPPGVPFLAFPPISVTIAPALVGDILIVIAMWRDWRVRGSIHPVYLVGVPVMLLLQLTVTPVANSDAWQAFAAMLGHLTG